MSQKKSDVDNLHIRVVKFNIIICKISINSFAMSRLSVFSLKVKQSPPEPIPSHVLINFGKAGRAKIIQFRFSKKIINGSEI